MSKQSKEHGHKNYATSSNTENTTQTKDSHELDKATSKYNDLNNKRTVAGHPNPSKHTPAILLLATLMSTPSLLTLAKFYG
jgi:hypothetical protein